MRYDPKQATAPGGKPGTYYYTVVNAEEKRSKQGNDMMELTLAVDTPMGGMTIKDYLVATPGGLWKAKAFCGAVGLDFEAGELTPQQCLHKSGQATLDFDKRDLEKVNRGEAERAYLKVQRYVKDDPTKPQPAPAAAPATGGVRVNAPPVDDDIPF